MQTNALEDIKAPHTFLVLSVSVFVTIDIPLTIIKIIKKTRKYIKQSS